MTLARSTSVPTPTIGRLFLYYEPGASKIPEGSSEIPLRWAGLVHCVAAIRALAAGGVLLARRLTHAE